MMSSCLYNLQEINRIKREGFSYTLPNEVIANIKEFETLIVPIEIKKKRETKTEI